MNEFMFLVFFFLLFVIVVLGLLLGVYFFTRPAYLLDRVFPKEKPKANLFFSKVTGEADRFTLYYFARLLAACLIAISIIWIWRAFT
ncbi:MAG: hypothetical protein IPI20_18630 [Rhodoferax sp.]|nr:hypothetical protein [Rhodoferax sp.]